MTSSNLIGFLDTQKSTQKSRCQTHSPFIFPSSHATMLPVRPSDVVHEFSIWLLCRMPVPPKKGGRKSRSRFGDQKIAKHIKASMSKDLETMIAKEESLRRSK